MSDARIVAYDLTRRVNSQGGFLGLLLQYSLDRSGLDSRDRALVAEISYGIQRHRNLLDYIISHFSTRPLEDIQPEVLDLLRLGVYQIAEMRIPAHASVNETVQVAKLRLHQGAATFVNAVLRKVSAGLESMILPERDDFPRFLETVYSHPRWLVDYILKHMDQGDAEALCSADNVFTGLTLRVNPDRIDAKSLMSEIQNEGGMATASPYLGEALIRVHISREQLQDFINRGFCTVQGESSMLVSHVVDPSPGDMVIDVCAAPGGKTTHLAQLGGNTCRVIAMDVQPRRVEALHKAIERLGLENIDVLVGDGTRLEEFVDMPADAVLVDAPCSGLGTLQRKPELKWRRLPDQIAPLAKVQLALLEGSAPVIRPGGVMVYSACTFTLEETVDVLKAFLERHPDYRFEDLSHYLPPALRKGLSPEGYVQLMPHMHAMEGMFIARLVKSEGSSDQEVRPTHDSAP